MISVQSVTKRFGPHMILDDVSCEIRRGEVAVIIGPSGGGKSTLLRCINGLEEFQSGTIGIGDPPLNPNNPASLRQVRQQVGMVFQQFNLFPHLSALENVLAGPLWSLGQRRAEAEPLARQLLERVGLSDKLTSRPDQLSGGQQQRVAIARALAVKPAAILFDEPTSALDPRMAGEVLAVIADLAKQGQTMMVVTHSMQFARQVGQTIFLMEAGKIVESGPPEQLFDRPKTESAKRFLQQARQV